MGLTDQDKKTLRDAYNIIRDKERWTQKAFARTEQGSCIDVLSPYARSFCLVGAITRITGSSLFYGSLLSKRLTNAIVPKRYIGCQLVEYNDSVKHETLMRRIRQALKE